MTGDIITTDPILNALTSSSSIKNDTLERVGTAAVKTLTNTIEDSLRANQGFAAAMGDISRRGNDIIDAMAAIQARKAEIQQNPVIYNRIMGLFDEKYNEASLNNRLLEKQAQLAGIDRQAEATKIAYAAAQDANRMKVQYSGQAFDMVSSILSKRMEAERHQWASDNQAYLVRTREIESASSEQLAQWINNPSSAPTHIKSMMGHVQNQYFQKTAQQQQLTANALSINAQQDATISRNLQTKFTDAQLQSMANSGSYPQGVSPQMVQDELSRRSMVAQEREKFGIALESSKIALEAGKADLAQYHRTRALEAISDPEDLVALMGQAEANGGKVTIDGVEFNSQDIFARWTAANEQQRGLQAQKIAAATAAAELEPQAMAAVARAENIARLQADGHTAAQVDATKAASPIMLEIQAKQNAFTAAMQNGDVITAKKYLDDLNAKTTAAVEEAVKSYAEPEREAVKQFIETGAIQSPKAALDMVYTSTSQRELFADHPIYAQPWSDFVDAVQAAQESNSTSAQIYMVGGDEGMPFPTPGPKLKEDGIIRAALKESKFKEKIQQGMYRVAATQAISNLAQQNPVYRSLLRSDGSVDPKYLESRELLLTQLETLTQYDHRLGTLDKNLSYTENFLNEVKRAVPQVAEVYRPASPQAAAVERLVGNHAQLTNALVDLMIAADIPEVQRRVGIANANALGVTAATVADLAAIREGVAVNGPPTSMPDVRSLPARVGEVAGMAASNTVLLPWTVPARVGSKIGNAAKNAWDNM